MFKKSSALILKLQSGFTVIEVMVVVTIFTLLIGFASINLVRPQTQASLDTIVKTLVSDIRQQQVKAMGGDTDSTSAAIEHSIRFETNRYIIFRGITYNPSEPSNFAVDLDGSLQISPIQEVVFVKRSGEVLVGAPMTINITNTQTGQQKIITINKYGAITIQ